MRRQRISDQEHAIWTGFLFDAVRVSTEHGVGKVLGGTRYIHRSVLTLSSMKSHDVDGSWSRITGNAPYWNVLRVNPKNKALALLSYPHFDTIAHPKLEHSVSVDLVTCQTVFTDFSPRDNPPILHRKELFLHPTYPDYELFRSLTAAEEGAGLLNDNRKIGYAHQWSRRLDECRCSIEGHRLK